MYAKSSLRSSYCVSYDWCDSNGNSPFIFLIVIHFISSIFFLPSCYMQISWHRLKESLFLCSISNSKSNVKWKECPRYLYLCKYEMKILYDVYDLCWCWWCLCFWRFFFSPIWVFFSPMLQYYYHNVLLFFTRQKAICAIRWIWCETVSIS